MVLGGSQGPARYNENRKLKCKEEKAWSGIQLVRPLVRKESGGRRKQKKRGKGVASVINISKKPTWPMWKKVLGNKQDGLLCKLGPAKRKGEEPGKEEQNSESNVKGTYSDPS